MDPLLKKYKVLIIGNSSVGKTSLLLRHVEGKFTEEVAGTIGVDYRANTYMRDGQRHDLQIWDTAGQDRFHNVTRAYYRDANAALLVFDLSNHASFDAIERWHKQLLIQIGEITASKIILILVGNKCDKPHRAVTLNEIQELATRLKITSYVETSAKKGTRVDEVFQQLLEKLIAHKSEGIKIGDGTGMLGTGIKVTQGSSRRRTDKCC